MIPLLVAIFDEYPAPVRLLIWSIIANMAFIATWLIFGFLLLKAPEARFFLGLFFKRGGAVLEAVNPAGGVKFTHVVADSGQGVLKGGNKLYVFIHRLLKLDAVASNTQGATESEEDKLAKGRKTYNELLMKRNILEGCGRVLYHGLTGSSIGGTAKLIGETEKARIQALQEGKSDPGVNWEDLAKLIRKNRPEEAILVTPFSVESLAEYVKVSYSPQDIQVAWDEGYLAGLGVKGKGGFSIWWLLIIVGIILLVLALVFYLSGGGGGAPNTSSWIPKIGGA